MLVVLRVPSGEQQYLGIKAVERERQFVFVANVDHTLEPEQRGFRLDRLERAVVVVGILDDQDPCVGARVGGRLRRAGRSPQQWQ